MPGYIWKDIQFWDELYQLNKNNDNGNFKEWLVKLFIHLEKNMKKVNRVKRKKSQ